MKIGQLRTTDKILKYHRARQMGHNKAKSKEIAGYSAGTNTVAVENTQVYKSLSIKDSILGVITQQELANEHLKNIKQDTDRSAKNVAIKLAYDRIEPEFAPTAEVEKVVVVLAGSSTVKDAEVIDATDVKTSATPDAVVDDKG